MFGVILFWIHYIIAGTLLYHIFRCIYVKEKVFDNGYRTEYAITDNDIRLKHPLWVLILFIIIFFIPVINITFFGMYLAKRMICENGSEHNPYYCKSIFTKKY